MKKTEDIIHFIASISKIPKHQITQETLLYNSSTISSLKLLELMAFIEKNFNITIKPEELIEDNFKNVKTLTDFIERKITQ